LFWRLAPVELLLALCLAGSRIAFIYALPLTTVASVMVFQAVSPRGETAWVWLSERLRRRTLLAILVAFARVSEVM
jgi:drug/metabolite transporter (DMT)-like permease